MDSVDIVEILTVSLWGVILAGVVWTVVMIIGLLYHLFDKRESTDRDVGEL